MSYLSETIHKINILINIITKQGHCRSSSGNNWRNNINIWTRSILKQLWRFKLFYWFTNGHWYSQQEWSGNDNLLRHFRVSFPLRHNQPIYIILHVRTTIRIELIYTSREYLTFEWFYNFIIIIQYQVLQLLKLCAPTVSPIYIYILKFITIRIKFYIITSMYHG